MNYVISTALLLFMIMLFIRSVLPRSPALDEPVHESDKKSSSFKIEVLSMNSSETSPRGGGIDIHSSVREIKRFFRAAEKRLALGDRIEDFEKRMILSREIITGAMTAAEKAAAKFFGLPHREKYPRLYELCFRMVADNGGYVDGDTVKNAVTLYNRHSPLRFEEIRLLKPMLAFCLIKQLALLCEKSEEMYSFARKAARDAAKEKVDLTSLTHDAYVFEYAKRVDSGIARKFSALCLENGVDVQSKCDAYADTVGSCAGIAYAATEALSNVAAMCDSFILGLYRGYKGFAAAYGDVFETLTPDEKSARLYAFGMYCKRRKTDEIAEAEKADREFVRSVTDKAAPSVPLLAVCALAVVAVGILPIVLTAVFFPPYMLPCAVLACVTVFSAGLSVLIGSVSGAYGGLCLKKTARGSAAKSAAEFASDIADASFPQSGKGEITASARLNVFLAVIAKTENVFMKISPVCALVLVFLAPIVSPYWLIAAFASEAVSLMFGFTKTLTENETAARTIARTFYAVFSLPERALESAAGFFGRQMPLAVKAAMQIASGALLAFIALLGGGNSVVYTIAGVFAVQPLIVRAYGYASERKRKALALPVFETQHPSVYDDIGVYPRLRFLIGGDYICAVSERGGVYDMFGSDRIFGESALAAAWQGAQYNLELLPPFSFEHGRTVSAAVCGERKFTVEISACGIGGKTIRVRSADRQEFTLICKHVCADGFEPADKRKTFGACDVRIWRRVRDGAVSVAAACETAADMSAETDVPSQCAAGKAQTVICVTLHSVNGEACAAFAADCDDTALGVKISCVFKNGYAERSLASAAAVSKCHAFSPQLYGIASHLMFGRCFYRSPDIVGKYIDTRLNTAVCYSRGGANSSKLYAVLKDLALLKRMGMRFNVAVLDFGGERKSVCENKVMLMIDELSLGKNGSAVYIDADKNREVGELLKESSVDAEITAFAVRTPNPKVTSYRRAKAKQQPLKTVVSASGGAVAENGDCVCGGSFGGGNPVNVVADSEGMGFAVGADGSGFTFFDDPWTNKLTGADSPLSTLGAEFVVIGECGRIWSATPLPMGEKNDIVCRHSVSSSAFYCVTNGLNITQKMYVSGKKAKVWDISVFNPRKSRRKLSVCLCVRPVLGEDPSSTRTTLEMFAFDGGIGARNVGDGKAMYLKTDAPAFSYSFGLESMLGSGGGICKISDLKNEGITPALAVSADFVVLPEAKKNIRFALTCDPDFSLGSAEQPRLPDAVSLVTYNPLTDMFVNRLPHYIRARLLGDIPTAANGLDYASSLLCALSLIYEQPSLCRRAVLKACAKQFSDGGILLEMNGKKGRRSCSSAARFFLPIVTARYIDVTDERDILFERVAFCESGSEKHCRSSQSKASVLEHCLCALNEAGEEEKCFGIDFDLLKIYAISEFMPLVKDIETRLYLADVKSELTAERKDIFADSMSAQDAAWTVISQTSANVSSDALIEKSLGASPLAKLWICAALIGLGCDDAAYRIFESLNPYPHGAAIGFDSVTASVARMIAVGGFFGCAGKGDCFVFSPHLPKKIKRAKLVLKFASHDTQIEIDNTSEGKWRINIDGVAYNTNSLQSAENLSDKKLLLRRGK